MTAVRRAGVGDVDAVVQVLAAAFMDGPASSWVFPERTQREVVLPDFFNTLVRSTLVTGEVDVTKDGGGVAVWQPIKVPIDVTLDAALFERTFAPIYGEPTTRRLMLLSQAEADRHPQRESHCHLPFLAVHPDSQGLGLGSTLLRHRLDILDAEGTPAYLEATSPRTRALYGRFGFVDEGEPIALPDGPELFPMWRTPRAPLRTK